VAEPTTESVICKAIIISKRTYTPPCAPRDLDVVLVGKATPNGINTSIVKWVECIHKKVGGFLQAVVVVVPMVG
jgi:hypothetical protein